MSARPWGFYDGGIGDEFYQAVAYTNLRNARATLEQMRARQNLGAVANLVAGDPQWAADLRSNGVQWKRASRMLENALTQAERNGDLYIAYLTEGGGYPWNPKPVGLKQKPR